MSNTTIQARTYSATTQAVAEAIARSISHDEIVAIDAGPHYEAICSELFEACEGCAADAEPAEYWGANIDGDEWRVHVRRDEV